MIKFLKLNCSIVNSLIVSKVRVKFLPRGFSLVMAAISNKVGVNIPQEN